MKLAEIKEQAVEVATEIKDRANIDTLPYAWPGVGGKDIVSLGIDQKGFLRIWPGVSDIDIAPKRRIRQAVLRAVEEERDLTANVKLHVWPNHNEWDRSGIRRGLISHFPIGVPRGTKFEVEIGELPSISIDRYVGASRITRKVTAHIPRTDQAFLVGMDETANFVAMLPKVVTTVDAAHDLLRPASARRVGTLRQGEFFLVPVGKGAISRILQALPNQNTAMAGTRFALEPGSSHRAALLVNLEGERYVTGLVWDSRKDHHKALVLSGWYRVVRNTEVVVPRQTRRWD